MQNFKWLVSQTHVRCARCFRSKLCQMATNYLYFLIISERRSIELRLERALVTSERDRRSNSYW